MIIMPQSTDPERLSNNKKSLSGNRIESVDWGWVGWAKDRLYGGRDGAREYRERQLKLGNTCGVM